LWLYFYIGILIKVFQLSMWYRFTQIHCELIQDDKQNHII
jgi:hypothetical protein